MLHVRLVIHVRSLPRHKVYSKRTDTKHSVPALQLAMVYNTKTVKCMSNMHFTHLQSELEVIHVQFCNNTTPGIQAGCQNSRAINVAQHKEFSQILCSMQLPNIYFNNVTHWKWLYLCNIEEITKVRDKFQTYLSDRREPARRQTYKNAHGSTGARNRFREIAESIFYSFFSI